MSKLFCFKDLVFDPDAIKGKIYEVIEETDDMLTIKNEHGELHHFTKDENDDAYFGKWFFNIKE